MNWCASNKMKDNMKGEIADTKNIMLLNKTNMSMDLFSNNSFDCQHIQEHIFI